MTPAEIDALLAGFRDWLLRTVATDAAAGGPALTALAGLDAEPPDLHSLLSQLIALKQEVNLQTRATRTQQEQSAETLRQLAGALETLEADRQAEEVDDEDDNQAAQLEPLRPLLKTMVDAHDALSLARREVRRIQEGLAQAADIKVQSPPPAANRDLDRPTIPQPRLPWLVRWLGLSQPVAMNQDEGVRLAQEQAVTIAQQWQDERNAVRALVDSIVTGYAMSLQRLERALDQHGLVPIECVGETFDPETMEVVEVVHEPGRCASEVIEEVRRGYLWQGRVFRFAQVKVARGT